LSHTLPPRIGSQARRRNSTVVLVVLDYPTLCGAMAWSKVPKVKSIVGTEVRRAPSEPGHLLSPRRQALRVGSEIPLRVGGVLPPLHLTLDRRCQAWVEQMSPPF
jgi:hypothetical protein